MEHIFTRVWLLKYFILMVYLYYVDFKSGLID